MAASSRAARLNALSAATAELVAETRPSAMMAQRVAARTTPIMGQLLGGLFGKVLKAHGPKPVFGRFVTRMDAKWRRTDGKGCMRPGQGPSPRRSLAGAWRREI